MREDACARAGVQPLSQDDFVSEQRLSTFDSSRLKVRPLAELFAGRIRRIGIALINRLPIGDVAAATNGRYL